MKRILFIATVITPLILSSCSNKPADKTDTSEGTNEKTPASDSKEILAQSGVLMPDENTDSNAINHEAVSEAAAIAQNLEGSRDPFSSFHKDVAPLLPTSKTSGLNLIPAVQCETIDTDGNTSNDCSTTEVKVEDPVEPKDEKECPKVCATACASATATAAAAAFAHASVQTCAFAEAWACVFSNLPPFGQVCTWAKSEACASAFAVAFGFGYATSTDQECKTVCSDGTSTVTKGPAPEAKQTPATVQ